MKIWHYLIAFFVAPFLVSFLTHDATMLGLSVLVTLAFFWVTTRNNKRHGSNSEKEKASTEKEKPGKPT